jgi:hypothetical protein
MGLSLQRTVQYTGPSGHCLGNWAKDKKKLRQHVQLTEGCSYLNLCISMKISLLVCTPLCTTFCGAAT